MSGTARKQRRRQPQPFALERTANGFVARFISMASPCEVLLDTAERREAVLLAGIAQREAERIERKFSRYRPDNIVHRINHSRGTPVPVDEETARLIDYAVVCYESSGGLFDITSGVLRRVWTFDGGDRVPDAAAIQDALRQVGWNRVTWTDSKLTLPEGMEIDLGGIGKEYAVDRAATLLASQAQCEFLVNFGGDLFASGPRRDEVPWGVGVDDPDRPGQAVLYRVDLTRGALATSGDARRFVMWQGRRLGHILDPRTGWPVENAPRSVTVLGSTCIEAGSLATMAYLKGPEASDFLREQGVQFWVL